MRRSAVRAEGGFADRERQVLWLTAPGLGVPDHVPNHESCAKSTPELARRFPLAMISPPARNFLNSSFVNVRSLRDIEGEPLLEIHADDAASRGIGDGQVVRVFNDRAATSARRASANARGPASSTVLGSGGASSGWRAPTSTR